MSFNNSVSDKIEISNDALIHANSLRNNNLQQRQLKEVIKRYNHPEIDAIAIMI